jgi:hypothetical protein
MLKRTNISVLAWRVNFIYLINVCDNLLVQDDRQGVSLWMSINSVEVFSLNTKSGKSIFNSSFDTRSNPSLTHLWFPQFYKL